MIIEFYKGMATVRKPAWFWRLKAKNGKTIADGSESYSNRGNVKRACGKVAALMKPGSVTIVEGED